MYDYLKLFDELYQQVDITEMDRFIMDYVLEKRLLPLDVRNQIGKATHHYTDAMMATQTGYGATVDRQYINKLVDKVAKAIAHVYEEQNCLTPVVTCTSCRKQLHMHVRNFGEDKRKKEWV